MTETDANPAKAQVTADDVVATLMDRYRRRIGLPGLLTTGQVADLIEVSEATVKRWCNDGRMESVRSPGGHRRIPAQVVADYMNGKGYQKWRGGRRSRQATASAEERSDPDTSPNQEEAHAG